MIKVWLLIVFLSGDARGFSANGPMVIDNIATKEECDRLVAHVKYMEKQNMANQYAGVYRCVEVWKVKQ